MSLSCRSNENKQLVAFWAQFLLVHLGGQDTITAYAMEDNELWLRHLLTLVVQAVGAAYVLKKYMGGGGGGGALIAAAILIFLVGVIKYGERIYAFKSTSQENIIKFLDGVEMPPARARQNYPLPEPGSAPADAEEVLEGAHELLPVCMGQFVDYKVWPSKYLCGAIKLYHGKGNEVELIGMQLSLMHDVLYTKAAVIHTWHGCCIRGVSVILTVAAFILFSIFTTTVKKGSGSSSHDHDRVNIIVTYILLGGALFVEIASVIRSGISTWTCALLRMRGVQQPWQWLHYNLLSLRRRLKAAKHCRKWSGSIGQHNLPYFIAHGRSSVGYRIAACVGLEHSWNKLDSRYFKSIEISRGIQDLVAQEIERMVRACEGEEDVLWSYGGQRKIQVEVTTQDRHHNVLTCDIDRIGFDGTILAWHYATNAFLEEIPITSEEEKTLAAAVGALSNYMMFLFLESPHLLPSPVRRTEYDNFCNNFEKYSDFNTRKGHNTTLSPAIRARVNLARWLIGFWRVPSHTAPVLRTILGEWVKILCYAASHCSRDAHARQLSSGTEFITLVWVLTTSVFNCYNADKERFKHAARDFLIRRQPPVSTIASTSVVE
uniref:Uncharacterized protein n=1 Tax=Avena sativa TaxID=4498 RepID=A0ACD5UVZ1_AVESA